VRPEFRDQLFGPAGLRLDDWLRAGQAHVVKQGPHRTIYRVVLPGLGFYFKHYRVMDTRSWMRQRLRPAKARTEHDRAVDVAARGVPTVVPLGWGESCAGPGDTFLLTRALENVEPLSAFIETTLPGLARRRQARLRQDLALALGRFLARVHQAGVCHRDLHAGNLLVGLEPGDQLRLYLIDLHAVRLGRPLGGRASRENLVIFNRWFILRSGRADRLRFWRAYHAERVGMGPGVGAVLASAADPASRKALAAELEERTQASNLRFWRNRDRRCLVSNRYYQTVRSAAAAGCAVRDLDAGTLAGLLADPDEPFRRPGVVVLKDSTNSTVVEFDVPGAAGPCRVVYKRFRVTAWSDPLAALVRRAPALRSWVHGHGLRERCLPTARPLAVLHRRRVGLFFEGYLLAEKIPAAVDLQRWVADLGPLNAAERRAVLRGRIDQVARLVRTLHGCQLSHRDLKAANLLVQGTGPKAAPGELGRVWLIDLVGVHRHRTLPRARRVQNLARLHASFHRHPALTRTDKLRFLRTYLHWGLAGRGGWKGWWHDVERATGVKIARNRRSGRPLG
jgi:tRNA A-37 threonylcarbamoyl transferase component Bud32